MNYDSRSPLYLQVQQYIQKRIDQGELQPHDRIQTEKELMDLFQVSRITVVNALAALVKEGYIYRVPGRGSFVADQPKATATSAPSVTESMPSQDHSSSYLVEAGSQLTASDVKPKVMPRTVGLIMTSLNDYFEIRIINAIKQALKEHGLTMLLAFSGGSKEQEEQLIRQFKEIGVEGLLLFPVDEDVYNEEILSLKVNEFPFVLIDRYLPGFETHFVCSDNRLGAQMAVSHLMELGHRDIAICTDAYRGTMSVQDRIQGYMDAYQQSGEMINPALILTDFSVPLEQDAMMKSEIARYIKSGMATAYIALNGQLGLRIKQIATKLGLKVPEDISIVNFDDPGIPNGQKGYFTHIDQHEAEIGRLAAHTLADLLDQSTSSKRNTRYEKIMLKPELVIRESTAKLKRK